MSVASPSQSNSPASSADSDAEPIAGPSAGSCHHPPALPTPAERPEADVVLYDGECNFCRSQIRQLRWWDCQGKLAYLSIHDPQVAERWPDLSHERLLDEMCVIERPGSRHAGRCHWGPEAVRYFSRRLRRLWWLAPLMHLPGMMFIARPVYRFIARNRYRIAGRTQDCESGSCSLHHR